MRMTAVLGVLLWAGAALADAPSTALPPATTLPEVAVSFGVKIPLRDGVHLNATRYAASGSTDRLPCVFTLTPYISQTYHDRGLYFAQNGYVFLTVDVRGRGNSEGEFTPLLQEAKDGHDVVEWLAKQPYCNGKVTMWGGSYAGYDQWATAKEFPKGLATIVPVASPYAGVDFPMAKNMFYAYDIQWLTLVFGKAAQDRIFGDSSYWAALYKRMYDEHLPFRSLDTLVGMPSKAFKAWISHPEPDAYWDSYNPSAAELARIDMPILTITGHNDGDQPGALEHYRQHLQHASAAARARHFLIIGPWDHAGTRTPVAEFGGMHFGEASVLDLNALHKAWYDWTLKDGAKPEFLKDQVAYYVTGAEQWRYAATLDAVTAEHRTYALDSVGSQANDVFASGSLTTGALAVAAGAPDRYVYDPLDIRGSEMLLQPEVESLIDQRSALLNIGNQLIYHTAAFTQNTDLAGFFAFDAWLALDQPDTDFWVSVYEIRPDGSSVFLSSDGMRARYRDNPRKATAVEPGKVERYRFDDFSFVARTIGKGSRLRLVFGAVDSPYAQRNYNSGGVVADESAKDAHSVTVTLYHDAEHPSALSVPIAAGQ